jgi:riboflavin transporter FmnP
VGTTKIEVIFRMLQNYLCSRPAFLIIDSVGVSCAENLRKMHDNSVLPFSLVLTVSFCAVIAKN